MKAIKQHLKVVAIFLSVLMLFLGCTVYKSVPVSLEEAQLNRRGVKITMNNGQIYTFSILLFEDGEYYGYSKANMRSKGNYKVHLVKDEIKKIQLKDYKKSRTYTTVTMGIIGAAILGIIIVVLADSFDWGKAISDN